MFKMSATKLALACVILAGAATTDAAMAKLSGSGSKGGSSSMGPKSGAIISGPIKGGSIKGEKKWGHARYAYFGPVVYASYDSCRWLKVRAIETGSPRWWARYEACRDES